MNSPTPTCQYRNCVEPLPEGHAFRLCDKCRILDMWDSLHICLDPTLPRFPHLDSVVEQRILTRMSGEEAMLFHKNLEDVYLAICKFKKLHSPEPTAKRIKLTLQEQIEEGRASIVANDAPARIAAQAHEKRAKKKHTVIQRQMLTMGCSEDCMGTSSCTHEAKAKAIFNDDFGDL